MSFPEWNSAMSALKFRFKQQHAAARLLEATGNDTERQQASARIAVLCDPTARGFSGGLRRRLVAQQPDAVSLRSRANNIRRTRASVADHRRVALDLVTTVCLATAACFANGPSAVFAVDALWCARSSGT